MIDFKVLFTQIVGSLIAYLAVRGLDKILAKWIAYFTIVWEKVASQQALEEYRKGRIEIVQAMPDQWKVWETWRKSRGPIKPTGGI